MPIHKLSKVGFTDRYDALGIDYPDPNTMCLGDCEGTGWVPICEEDPNPVYHALWLEAEKIHHEEDGWQFVVCPDCGGTGKRVSGKTAKSKTSLFSRWARWSQKRLIEELASIEHDRWAHWQEYLHSKCVKNEDGSLTIPSDLVEHWEKQIATKYQDLSEKEKDSDREQVDTYFPVIQNYFTSGD